MTNTAHYFTSTRFHGHFCALAALLLSAACSAETEAEPCTVTRTADGTATIVCPDGTEAVIADGQDGARGQDGAEGVEGSNGADGADGDDGASCSAVDEGDGTVSIVCAGKVVATLAGGSACSVSHDDGEATITCDDGSSASVADGTGCSAADNGDGTLTVTCADGTSATWHSGAPVLPKLALGAMASCAIRAGDQWIECWGEKITGLLDPPSGRFVQIVSHPSSSLMMCARREDGTVACWGEHEYTIPTEAFVNIVGRRDGACGERADGTVLCWGDGGSTLPVTGPFDDFTYGTAWFCGIKSADGSIACGGVPELMPQPESGTYKDVESGPEALCALRSDDTVVCFDGDEASDPLEGTFTAMAVGQGHVCGLRTDGTIACSGNDTYGQSSPPAGEFVAIESGEHHSCAVRVDGQVICWGRSLEGESDVPATL